ncbi:hypothetical protein, partial [Streptomyces sp. NPDC056512]|uniref:hypothetical protein n=1 Tax=Streptomyces sp. NPDC056512 TaxID=3345846 RepID=UPI0036C92242
MKPRQVRPGGASAFRDGSEYRADLVLFLQARVPEVFHRSNYSREKTMAGPQQPGLLGGVVASHAVPAIVRHPARKGPTPIAGCR